MGRTAARYPLLILRGGRYHSRCQSVSRSCPIALRTWVSRGECLTQVICTGEMRRSQTAVGQTQACRSASPHARDPARHDPMHLLFIPSPLTNSNPSPSHHPRIHFTGHFQFLRVASIAEAKKRPQPSYSLYPPRTRSPPYPPKSTMKRVASVNTINRLTKLQVRTRFCRICRETTGWVVREG